MEKVTEINSDINDTFQEETILRVKDDLTIYTESHDIDLAPKSAAIKERPQTGNVSILTMPVYFSDKLQTTSQSTIDNRWDAPSASVQHYYLENSFNQFNLTVETKSWIMANDTIVYYGNNAQQIPREFDLATFVMDYWDSTVDFNDYDYVFIVYAGEDDTNDTRLWPHVWTIYGDPSGYIPLRDGITYDKLGFVGEFSAMGTYAHEFGHSLGLIDYYPTSGEQNCGYWELMDTGNYNDGGNHPAHLSVYSKMELGWINSSQVLELSANQIANVKLYHLEEGNLPLGYYYALKVVYNETIYFLIEFRDNHGYDAYLPDSGVLWVQVDLSKGSTEGRLYYLGGDHNVYELTGVELDDTETENTESFIQWLTSSWEMSVMASIEYPNYMETIVDRQTDLGDSWNIQSGVAASANKTWLYENLNKSDLLIINWDTPGEVTGSDFRIRNNNTGTWVNMQVKDNIWQDSLIYRIITPGDYQIVVINDNAVLSMNIYYQIWALEAPLTSLTYLGQNTIYLTNQTTQFDLTVNASNLNTAWDENANITIILPSDLQLAPGETVVKNWWFPYYLMKTTFTWKLLANTTGPKTIIIQSNATYNTTTLTLNLNFGTDSIPPTVSIIKNSPILYTNFIRYRLNWTVRDLESGIKNISLYQNGTWLLNGDSSFTGTWVTLLSEGYFQYVLSAYDNYANQGNDSVLLCYDYTQPEFVSLDSSINGLSLGIYALKFTARDILSGINHVEIWINNKLLGNATLDAGQYQFDIDLNNYTDKSTVTVEIRIFDEASNFYVKNITLSIGVSIIDFISNLTTTDYVYIGVGLMGIAIVSSWVRGRNKKKVKK